MLTKNSSRNNILNAVFSQKTHILIALEKFAPTDDVLLMIPRYTNVADPFFSFIAKANALGVSGFNLVNFFQSINRDLAVLYASHKFILFNRNIEISEIDDQSKIDSFVVTGDLIVNEYRLSLRNFISNLRIGVDQLILLLTTHIPEYNFRKIDNIGNFLSFLQKKENKIYDKRFLVMLNAGANFLKHHDEQFHDISMLYTLLSPALPMFTDKSNKKNSDYFNIKLCFSQNEYAEINENRIYCTINCDFLINGFNQFFKTVRNEFNGYL